MAKETKKKRERQTIEIAGFKLGGEAEVGCVKSHFLDSGAFSLWVRAKAHAKEHGVPLEAYYTKPGAPGRFTKRFLKYLDAYAQFIKEYAVAIDLYANVDIISNPELTWDSQQYLEKEHGLNPVPVIHYKTDMKWIHHYLDKGYEIIGLGGLVGAANPTAWIDRCFHIVCNTPNHLPKVKVHGFGVTSFDYLIRFPWWSVDSTSWAAVGSYGSILVPHKRKGKFVFDEAPYVMKVSNDSPGMKKRGQHFTTLSLYEQGIVQEWLDFLGVPLGKVDSDGNILEYGVTNHHCGRRIVNLRFFKMLEDSLPKWPWPFQVRERRKFF